MYLRTTGRVRPVLIRQFDLTCICDIHRVNIFFDRYHNRPLMHTSLFLFPLLPFDMKCKGFVYTFVYGVRMHIERLDYTRLL